ncbi:hypothetical protein Patl1_14847 [Pistacia atlantica]|uniref:Uncharacterized protein n=1 Tax=Pistacia atlantica TaxID=434234 RepID=A0ACC1ARY6_9ROSI|nr:hypothetical protein Patl1_14847 [Pistacia atlantica]
MIALPLILDMLEKLFYIGLLGSHFIQFFIAGGSPPGHINKGESSKIYANNAGGGAKQPPLPPGPYSWPILGDLLQVGDKPHITLTKLAQTYGPLFSLRLGNQLVVVGSSQEAAIQILKTHDRILSGRYVPHVAPAKSLEHNNLSLGWNLECNNSWKLLRTLCRTTLFSSKAIESQSFIREKKVVDMVGFISKMQGDVVKIRQELLSAGTDTSSSTVEWTLAELLKHPKCMKKVEEELKKEIDQDLIKESHVPKLTFLQACVKETLRLHPPGPFLLPHRAVDIICASATAVLCICN